MLAQFIPALIMFAITLIVSFLLFLPSRLFRQKKPLISFYWAGFWYFLILIAGLAGLVNTLKILHLPIEPFGNILLETVTTCFVIFVVFGWFRLSSSAFILGVKRGVNFIRR